MNQKIRAVGAAVLVVVWVALTGFAWFAPSKDTSEAERRPLKQWPGISVETLLNGKFMSKFEEYTLDQFPGRDTFRQIKSLFHYYAMQQLDNNDIYIADGYAAKLEYPLNQSSVDYVARKFNKLYETYLQESTGKIHFAIAPDKGYYLAEENGYLAMDYNDLFRQMGEKLPWANFVDITDCLDGTDYYHTDTHWRQENLIPAAQKIAQALGVTQPKEEDFTKVLLDRPFYGVYYGQAALPMEPEDMYIMTSDLLSDCKVYSAEMNAYTDVYNMNKLTSKDLYDVFLSGPQMLLTIENPNAATDKELIVFRDSFGSSMAPLLVQDYSKVTVIDIRYIASDLLGEYVTFNGQDVLFLYSTTLLNNGITLK